MANRVWIIGAGFSRSLGGLLPDLLSQEMRLEIKARLEAGKALAWHDPTSKHV
jgi:hypothetical protein